MKQLDSAGLFITRKRKKWKFAHFDNWPNCLELKKEASSQDVTNRLADLIDAAKPTRLELAAGNAQFSFELARLYKDCNFVAIDIKSDRLYTSAKKALEENVDNIIFLRTHLNELTRLFKKHSVAEIWLTFPDPFSKKRAAKHRLTHPHFLEIYKQILKPGGVLRFKTDNLGLFHWSLEQFTSNDWRLKELTFDLHDSDFPSDYKIKTYYEDKYIKSGKTINYCSIIP